MKPWLIILAVASGFLTPAGRADEAQDLGKLPPLVRVADADVDAPITFEVARAELPNLLKIKAVESAADRKDGVRFRFTSAETAAKWFVQAKPVPPHQEPGGKQSITLLGWANMTYGPFRAPDGRAWFWRSNSWPRGVAEFKKRVEDAFQKDETIIDGVRIVYIDRSGRMWAMPWSDAEFMYGYDPKAKSWVQRRAGPHPEGFRPGSAFESKSGSLYFTDRSGVHVWDGTEWSRQPLFDRNVKGQFFNGTNKSFSEPAFREDAHGRVYVWAPWGSGATGTIGYWVHDGGKWSNVDAAVKVEQVIPRANGEAWLVRPDKQVSLWAGNRLITGIGLQEVICPRLQPGSVQFVQVDGKGTVYFQLRFVTNAKTGEKLPDRVVAIPYRGIEREFEGRAGQFLAMAGETGAVWDEKGWLWRSTAQHVEAMSPESKDFRELGWTRKLGRARVRGFDGRGGLYLEGSQLLWRVAADSALDLDGPGEAELPAMSVHVSEFAFPDSLGRMWCTWFAAGSPTAVFDGQVWNTLPGRREGDIRGFLAAFPGANGSMVLMGAQFHFHLFDDQGSVTAESAERLALEHPERLVRVLTNPPLPANNFYHHLVKDARGRIWWAHWFHNWGVVDGKEAISGKVSPSIFGGGRNGVFFVFAPLGDGRKILALDENGKAGILDVVNGEITKVDDIQLKKGERPTSGWWRNVLRDSSGRLWVMASSESHALDAHGQVVEKRRGLLKLEDRRKNLWFYESLPESRYLVRRSADGKEVKLNVLNLAENASMAEAPDGSIWALTTSHLIRVRADGDRLAVAEKYLVPTSGHDHIWCDKEGRVWQLHLGDSIPRGWRLIRFATTAN